MNQHMSRALSFVSARALLPAAIVVFAFCALPVAAVEAKVKVNCNLPGETISGALALNVDVTPLVIQVKGPCTDNVVLTRDDVTIKTNGIASATIVAADNGQPAILLDGAHRIVINGVVANGISVSGGTYGIDASRGSTLVVKNCAVTGASNTGIIGSYSSTVWVDGCSVTSNGGGVTAANTSSVAVTNSTVSNNAGNGLTAVRSSELRVGQNQSGNPIVQPVTVSGNGSNGIGITESSAGIVVGGTVETSGASNVFVGRGSSAQIGLGSNGLTGGVTVQNGSSNGIAIEGGNATIVFSTITGNALRGIVLANGGSARIGVTNNNGVFGANTISSNTTDGIGMFYSASAFIGGNTIDSNGAFGINIGQAAADLVGGNTITNNHQAGIFVRAGSAIVGDPGFGPPTSVNTISFNGSVGPTQGGVWAFEGGNVFMINATISNNTGAALTAFQAGSIDLRGSTAVTVPSTGTTPGAVITFGSTLSIRDTASIISATSDGIQASNLSGFRIIGGFANTVQGNGPGAHGINCFNTAPVTASAVSATGDFTNVTGTAGATVGCNAFP